MAEERVDGQQQNRWCVGNTACWQWRQWKCGSEEEDEEDEEEEEDKERRGRGVSGEDHNASLTVVWVVWWARLKMRCGALRTGPVTVGRLSHSRVLLPRSAVA